MEDKDATRSRAEKRTNWYFDDELDGHDVWQEMIDRENADV